MVKIIISRFGSLLAKQIVIGFLLIIQHQIAKPVCAEKPVVNISYTVKDTEAAKNTLLAKAVADAGNKAAVLADAADVRLMEIQSIDYSFASVRFESHPMRNMLMAKAAVADECCSSYDMDIQPDDIEVSDTVNVTWEIQ